MSLFKLFKSEPKEETPVEIPIEKPLVEIVDIEKPAEKAPTEYRKNENAYTITLETVCTPCPDNPEEVTWRVTAKQSIYEVIGIGRTLIKAKRNLYSQLKRMEKFAKAASVMVGIRTGIYACNSEFRKEDGEGNSED